MNEKATEGVAVSPSLIVFGTLFVEWLAPVIWHSQDAPARPGRPAGRPEAPLAAYVIALDHQITALHADVATLRATVERAERGMNEQFNSVIELRRLLKVMGSARR
jgi:hypothetical protein